MIEVTHKFNTIEEAAAFINSLTPGNVLAAIPAHIAAAPAPAPAPVYTAPAPAPQYAAPAPAPVAAPVAVPAGAPVISAAPAVDAAGGITAAQIGAAAQAYSKAYKAAATKAVFAQFGIKSVGEARPDQYPALLAALSVQ